MPGRAKTTLAACLCAAVLAGCGGSDATIPKGEADDILNQLAALQSDIENGRCELLPSHAGELTTAVNSLPDSVDPDVRQGVIKATAQIVELSKDADQCASTTGASGPADVTPTEPTSTPATTSTTSTTSTTDETTQDETTDQSDEQNQGGGPSEAPPGGGSQDGGNQGDGLGDGGPASGGITGG